MPLSYQSSMTARHSAFAAGVKSSRCCGTPGSAVLDVLEEDVPFRRNALPDWADVLDRSGEGRVSSSSSSQSRRSGLASGGTHRGWRPGRPWRHLLIAAAAAIAFVVAVPALGLPQRIANLFESGMRAPAHTERLFSTLDRGAPPGLETYVIPEQHARH